MKRSSSFPERLSSACRRSRFLRSLTLTALLPGLLFWTPVYSNPTGGVVVHGDVSMVGGAGNLTITQNSQSAIINWNDFSIDVGEVTRFVQPGSSAAVLNRVTGGNPSAIHGALNANGSVFVINPNGILVGPTGTIDVHGLVLSTLDITDGEFLAGGDMVFKGDSDAGITNMGRINGIGGDVFLIGKTITNTGSISASGTVGLGAGEEVLLTAPDGSMGERVFVRSTGSGASGTGVLNDGTIEGAAVELKAHGNLYALAINNKGSVRATGVDTEGGKVFLRGIGGTIDNSGSIEATATDPAATASVILEAAYARAGGFMSATDGDGSGGEVLVSSRVSADVTGVIDVSGAAGVGGRVDIQSSEIELGSSAQIEASGLTGGGTVRIGGGFQGKDADMENAKTVIALEGSEILADAIGSGDAGTVIVWADDETVFRGAIQAQARGLDGNGGFVEVSGKSSLTYEGTVSTLSANGSAGTLLLDPTDLTISTGSGANIINISNLITALNANNVVISTNPADTQDGDVRIINNVDYTSLFDLSILAHGDIEASARIQNQSGGDVNLVAGWDGSTGFTSAAPGTAETGSVNMNDFFNDSSTYGNAKTNGGNGSIIMTANSQRVSIGSRYGNTNVAAYGVDMVANGWGSTAQFGIFDFNGNAVANAASGDIRVDVHNAIVGTSPNQNAAYGAFQIGHGGVGDDNGLGAGPLSGDITVNAGVDGLGSGDISFVFNTSGDVERFYMQIGHGGRRNHGAHSGNIVVDTTAGTSGNVNFEAGEAARNYVQIGHGGENLGSTSDVTSNNLSPVNLSGSITVRTAGDLTFKGGQARGTQPSAGWRNTVDAYAMLGHGGRNADGSHSGAITVESGGDILFQSGDHARNFAQLGHGGGASDGDHSGVMNVSAGGTITFDARGSGDTGINFGGGPSNRNETYVQLGHGGYGARGTHSENITVTSGGDISFFGGKETDDGQGAYRAYAQLGHGGLDADNPNNNASRTGNSGNITINSGGALLFQAADADEAYVQLGHGGYATHGQDTGNIDITTAGAVTFSGGQRLSYAQLGHGGYDADGSRTGTIGLDAGGDITFLGGIGTQARDFRAFAQLGHGGYSTTGVHTGDITVSSDGLISFKGGNLASNYVQLGHGGRNARTNSNTNGNSGDISVAASTGISFTAGTMLERTAANGFSDLAPYATLPGDADATNGDEGIYADGHIYAHLGHGGYDADASTNNNYNAGVGHSGDVRVTTSTGDITFTAGSTANGSVGADEGRLHYVLLGHGGAAALGDHSGAIEVEATGGSIVFRGGAQTIDGGVNRNDGTVTIDQTDSYNSAQLGHGGMGGHWGNQNSPTNAAGRLSANSVGGTLGLADGISVTAGNSVQFLAGDARRGYAQLGLGGFEYRGLQDGADDHVGAISVTSGGGGITFRGGTNVTGSLNGTDTNNHGRESYAHLGHGGYDSDGTHSGAITVTTTDGGNVRFLGGTRYRNYAQLGHGGHASRSGTPGTAAGNSGEITVTSSGDVDFIAGTLYEADPTDENGEIYSMLGHGGRDADVFGDNTYVAGLGHRGDISVTAGGQLRVIGGNTANGSLGGGNGREHFAQIGHGGMLSGGDHSGAINIVATGAASILAGTTDDNEGGRHNHAMIGHGGAGGTNWGGAGGDLSSASLNGNADGVNVTAESFQILAGDSASFAHIGLGGRQHRGNHTGAVSVTSTTGDIVMTASNFNDTPAMIGNGGHDTDGNHDGEIRVTSGGALLMTAGGGVSQSWGASGNNAHSSPVQIGNGGHEADGDHTGNIIVRVTDQFELIAGQNGAYRNYAMIGNGGTFSSGTQGGLISVSAGAGTSRMIASQSLVGDVADESFTQIGHGGRGSDTGNKSGNIEVIITDGGNLDMVSGSGGAGGNAYTQIGHGGTGMTVPIEVSGSITVLVDGELSVVRNEAQTQIAHRGNTLARQAGDLDSDLTVLAGTIDNAVGVTNDLIRISDNVSEGQIYNVWLRQYLEDNSNNPTNIGDVTFGTFGTGSVDWSDVDFDYSSTKDLTLTAGGDIFFMKRIRNREQTGGGDVNVLGNWGGTVGQVQFDLSNDEAVTSGFDMAAVLTDAASATPTWAGTNSGNVIVGQDFNGTGNTGSVQVGSSTGTTSVLGNDVRVIAGGDEANNGRYAQIGVNDGTSGFRHTGDINVYANNNVEVRAGTAGGPGFEEGNRGAYGMIGHGGIWSSARLPELSGDITVDAGGSVLAVSGTNEYNYTQIGHGGAAGYDAANPTGKLFGDISVAARSGSIQFSGGTGLRSHAQIGHGGRDTDPHDLDSSNPAESSNITVTAGGDIAFRGGTGSVNPVEQTGRESYAMLGHGGYFSEVRTDNEGYYGDIRVTSGGAIDFRAGDSRDNFVQLGHGGRSRAGVNGAHSGDILVSAGTGVNFIGGVANAPANGDPAGQDSVLFAQLGHGGWDSDVNFSNNPVSGLGHTGDIRVVTTNGDINFLGAATDRTGDLAQFNGVGTTARYSYSQLGHGGMETKGEHSGAIEVEATNGDVNVLAGTQDDPDSTDEVHYAQVGHGGASFNWGGGDVDIPLSANSVSVTSGVSDGIRVTAGGNVNVVGSDIGRSFAMIGLGGWGNDGDHTGDISVNSNGDVLLRGGNSFQNFAHIGHGGREAFGNQSGDIEVTGAGRLDLLAGTGNDSYAMIGHGGVHGGTIPGNRSGDIFVSFATGIEINSGTGGGARALSRIGHGGYFADGNHSGFVTVVNSTSGDIVLRGGDGANDKSAQIGHRGQNSASSDLSGSISVVNLGGDISLQGGNGNFRGAIIGHGDAQEGITGGLRTGGVNVFASGAITLADGAGNSGSYIGHQTNSGIGSVSYAGSGINAVGDSGFSIVAGGGLTGDADFLTGTGNALSFGESIGAALAVGNVTIASGGTADLDLNALDATSGGVISNSLGSADSAHDVTFAAGGDLLIGFGIQNAGSGDVNLIAGWSGNVSNTVIQAPQMDALTTNPFFDDTTLALGDIAIPDFEQAIPLPLSCLEFGLNGGDIVLGNTGQTSRFSIGSRQGTTNVLGNAVSLFASNGTANAGTQIGFFTGASGDASGAINVGVGSGGLLLDSGNAGGAFTQIGHGGFLATGVNTTADADITISFCEPGDLTLLGGGSDSYAQIGHGGFNGSGNMDGNITVGTAGEEAGSIVMTAGNGNGAYVQIGHGGTNQDGTKTGNIQVEATTGITMTANDTGDRSDAFIGHGGRSTDGTVVGNIDVTSIGGDIRVNGGGAFDTTATIGHSGQNTSGSKTGNISVTAENGSVAILGGAGQNAVGSIGHGGSWRSGKAGDILSGSISVSATENVTLTGSTVAGEGSSQDGGALIGHGGGDNDATKNGAIIVTADSDTNGSGNVTLTGGSKTRTYAKIGHAGAVGSIGNTDGTVTVSGVDVTLTGGTGTQAKAMIGNGGVNNDADHSGNISVTATGNLALNGGGTNSFAHVGHGGTDTGGLKTGSITVDADGTLSLTSGAAGAYTQIGHGGTSANGGVDAGSSISINQVATNPGALSLVAGTGNSAYAQIGHGGYLTSGSVNGADITIDAASINTNNSSGGGNVPTSVANAFATYVQIGHGGFNESVDTGALRSGWGAGTRSGNIDIDVTGNFDFVGGSGLGAYAHVGHGGRRNNALAGQGHSGTINIDGSTIDFFGGAGQESYAMAGHGGFQTTGDHSGDITLNSTGLLRVRGDTAGDDNADRAFAQIGHGGYDADFDTSIDFSQAYYLDNQAANLRGNISVTSLNDNVVVRALESSAGQEGYAQIGHGGFDTTGSFGDVSESITVTAANGQIAVVANDRQASVDLSARANYAQIGHGGALNVSTATPENGNVGDPNVNLAGLGEHAGSITLSSSSVNVDAGRDNESYAQVGHGGFNNGVVGGAGHVGAISVTTSSGEVRLQGGPGGGFASHAQIGHGGQNSNGNHSGAITVNSGSNVRLLNGGATRAYTQIGHGGFLGTGNLGLATEDLLVTANGNIELLGGVGQSFAMIGHGGQNFDGNHSVRNLDVTATTGSITMIGAFGTAADAPAQIGLGGRLSDGDRIAGAINVTADGDITMNGSVGVRSGAQIGNGGDQTVGAMRGNISVASNNGIIRLDGNPVNGDRGAARSGATIGHGGFDADGTKDGNITVASASNGSGEGVILNAGGDNGGAARIGHGGQGAEGSIGSLASSNVSVTSGGTIDLRGNQNVGGNAATQIGHGGIDSGGVGNTITGTVTVTNTSGDILVTGSNGGTGVSYTQIGHGGINSTYDISGAAITDQDITVNSAAGAITLAGSGSQNHVMIGHGGENHTGDARGNIDVFAANAISMTSGTNTDAATQIGHGGNRETALVGRVLAGDIDVRSETSSVTLSTANGGNVNGTAVQIGHGGYHNVGGSDATIEGKICVIAGTTADLNAGGGGNEGSFAMIGHGGVRLAGDFTGDITVTTGTSGTGGITLTGGNHVASGNEFAQIGHGGIESNGLLSGDIYAIADNGGTISVNGGTGNASNYAMIGHGDGEGNTSQGQREGGLHLFTGAPGGLSVTNGAGLENTNIWHQTNGGLVDGDYLGGDGFQILQDLNTLAAQSAVDPSEVTVMTEGNFGAGSINVITSADTDLIFDGAGAGDIFVNSSDDFFLVTGGNITFANSYQNAGTGNVTIVAGWNGQGNRPPATVEYTELSPGVFNYCEPIIRESGVEIDFTNCDTFGNDIDPINAPGRGSITFGSSGQDNPVYVGSRLGRTIAAGYGITLNAGDMAGAATQLGFHNGSVVGSTGAMTGAIDVLVKSGGLTLNGGSVLDTYAQVGHGGTGATVDTINADITISFCEPGDILFNDPLVTGAGDGSHAYTQIGHGITDGTPTTNGEILIEGFRNITMNSGSGDTAFTMIGLGGDNSDGNKQGRVTLTGATEIADRGDITMNGGGTRAFAQIGIGGRNVNNFKFGATDISNVVDIDMNGGSGVLSYVHIGNGGGEGANGDLQGNIDIAIDGNLTLDAGTSGSAYAQVGHGGHSQLNGVMRPTEDNDITITTGGFVSMTGSLAGDAVANTAAQAYAQIGHGGRGSRGQNAGAGFAFERYGDINLTINGTDGSGNALVLQGGNSNETYVQLGHGGRDARGYYEGQIEINAAGNVSLAGGGRSRTYAMIGHGGDDADEFISPTPPTPPTVDPANLDGNGGDILLTTTNGGSLLLQGSLAPAGTGGDHNDSGAQIGHGGHATTGDHNGAITLDIAGDVNLIGGVDSDTNGADRNYAQIGHGGESAGGNHTGAISVTSGGAINATGGDGGFGNYAQVGHGGINADSTTGHDAAISLTAAFNISFQRNIGNANNSYAMVGHGGNAADGSKAGDISVVSTNGSILFGNDTARTGRSAVSIGHGGRSALGDTSGNITVQALNGDIRFHGTFADNNNNHREGYAQLGHGGRDAIGNHGTAANLIDVDSGGIIEFLAGGSNTDSQGTQGREAYAQLGNGGYGADGNHAGNIQVDAVSDITFDTRGISGDRSYVQLGHGGFSSNGSFSGNIDVNQNVVGGGGAITFLAGRAAAFAQLGHGGRNDAGSTRDNSGADGTPNTIDDVRIESSARFAPGTITGDIAVGATGDITFTGGFESGGTGYAQLGHGGYQQMALADEGHSGSIEVVTTGGAINFTAGTRNAQHAMIGHGGFESFGNHFGNITVEAATGIAFAGGGETLTGGTVISFAQIGHGGFNSDFEPDRAIGEFGIVNGAGGFNDDIPLADPGTMTGAISITTTGAGADILLTGAQGDNNGGRGGYVQFGHGGFNNAGDREGSITVESGGAVLLTRGTTDDAYVQIGHAGRNANGTIANADILVTSANGGSVSLQGGGLPATAGTSSRAYAQIGHGGHNADVQADSAVTVVGDGGVDILGGGGQEGFAMIGHGGDSSDAQGTGFDGSVSVTATTGDIVITSNTPAGDGGNRTFAKIGHGGYVSSTDADYSGDLTAIAMAGSIVATAGVDGNNNFVQIGHGGVANSAVTGHSGAINVSAANDITFTGGIDNLGAAGNDRQFAMIGHGGANSDGGHNGSVTVEAGTDGTGSITFQAGNIRNNAEGPFAHIGHGGQSHDGDLGGNISVTAADDLSMLGGTSTDGAYAQIGHGGRNAKGDRTGTIEATATNGAIRLVAGEDNNNYAQIGHGGHEGDFTGATGGTTIDDTIIVTAGTSIDVIGAQLDNVNEAAQSYAQIGHGGQYATGNHLAAITVDAGTNLSVTGGLSNQTYAQIGHGGLFNGGADPRGDQAGDIGVTAGGDITVTGGVRDRAYAQIGHGGFDHDGTKDGNINVTSTGGAVTVSGGSSFNDAYAQIGHGGGISSGVIGAISADITLNAQSGISVLGNQSAGGSNSSAIGHGGRDSGIAGETANGTITLITQTGDIVLTGSNGGSGNSYTQVGHAGYNSNYSAMGGITIDAIAGGITLVGSGAQNHTQIGHGGELSSGDYSGVIDVDAQNAIALTGGSNDDATAQIGHGGNASNGTKEGDISVTSDAGDISLDGGTATDEVVAQIGHGGARSNGAIGATDADITVEATQGSVTLDGGTGNSTRAGALIGHGGSDYTGSKDGDITVSGGGGLSLQSGGGFLNFAQIGHSSAFSSGDIGGRTAVIDIQFNGDIDLTGNQAGPGSSGTQIGHGGFSSGNAGDSISGAINVTSQAGDITVTGSANGASESYTQVGHGGLGSSYDVDAPVTLNSVAGGLSLIGASAQNHTQIGHGGERFIGSSLGGDIQVTTATAVSITGGSNTDSVAQIGHGGTDSTATAQGDISIEVATGDLTMTTVSNTGSYAHIGHGGRNSTGVSFVGDVDIALGSGSLVMNADAGGDHSFTQVGHGGSGATASILTGHICIDISTAVAGTGGIEMTAGDDFGEYAQIGHGGLDTTGAMSGGISAVVRNGGDLVLTGGDDASSSAAIGHGDGIAGTASGNRSGQIDLIVEGDTTLTDGTAGAAVFGHSTTTPSGVFAAGLGLLTHTLDSSNADLYGLTGAIERMAPGGEVEFMVTGGSLSIGGPGAFYTGAGNVDLVAAGSVNFLSSILNAGSGGINVVAGWDGTSGLVQATDFNSCPIITDLSVDADAILTDELQYGIGGLVEIGDGTQTGPLAVGSAGGKTRAVGAGVNLVGSDTTPGGLSQIGFNEEFFRAAGGGANGVASTGDIEVIGKAGGVNAFAGDANGAAAQIGHGGANNSSPSFSGDIAITSGSDVTVDGGDASGSFALIGHGGDFSNAINLTGDVAVAALNDINLVAGQGDRAFAQIGSGGSVADGNISGTIDVAAGDDILVDGSSAFQAAHAKIGFGDDPDSGLTGTGSRDGDVNVAAGTDITLRNGMIGHVNAANQGTNPTSGITQIGASRTSPTNPAGGSLTADSQSELAGPDGLRIYLPERSTNGIAAGANLNAVAFGGAQVDPSTSQGADEFAVLVGDGQGNVVAINQHSNAFGSGPAPANAGGFAFYYNRIVLTEIPDDIVPEVPGGGDTGGGGIFDPGNPDSSLPGTSISLRRAQQLVPDDRTIDDWQRDLEQRHTGFKFFEIFYEGFDQYGPNGEVLLYNALFGGDLDGNAGDDLTEDVLRRQLRILEEQDEQESGE